MGWVACDCRNGSVPVSFPHNGEIQTIWEPCSRCNGRGGWFSPDPDPDSGVGGGGFRTPSRSARGGAEGFSWGWAAFGVFVGLVVVGGMDAPFWPAVIVSALLCGVFHKTVGVLVSIGIIGFFCWVFLSAPKAKKGDGPVKSSSRVLESPALGGVATKRIPGDGSTSRPAVETSGPPRRA